jgi:hypothetical protein
VFKNKFVCFAIHKVFSAFPLGFFLFVLISVARGNSLDCVRWESLAAVGELEIFVGMVVAEKVMAKRKMEVEGDEVEVSEADRK